MEVVMDSLPEGGDQAPGERRVSGVGRLTARQLQMLELVRRGYRNRDIAAETGLRLTTVERHLTRAFKRLGVSSRTQAVLALERYMVERDRQPRRDDA